MNNLEYYIVSALEKKGSKVSERMPKIGDFIFDYDGNLIGFYQGEDRIDLIKKYSMEK